MAKKEIDIANLEEKLTALCGLDFEDAYRDEVKSGNTGTKAEIVGDRSFLMRLAAKALKVPTNDLKALSIKDYFKISEVVAIFLSSSLPTQADLIQLTPSADSQSA